MSFCNNCIHHDRDCVIDPPEGDYCRQYLPTILGGLNVQTKTAIESGYKPLESENPDHYKTGGIECIDAIRDALGHDGFIAYCRGQIIRYAWRIGKKDECLVEALKLEKYANWLVDEFNGKELRK